MHDMLIGRKKILMIFQKLSLGMQRRPRPGNFIIIRINPRGVFKLLLNGGLIGLGSYSEFDSFEEGDC